MINSNEPLVSVIIATYNSAVTLKCAIQSLVDQDFVDFEAWIIGDCCTDESAEVVMRFNDQRLQWHNLAVNSGSQGAPNNEGIVRSKGKYIAYLGHDDLWLPNHLSTLLKHIEDTGADFVYSLTAMIKPTGAFIVAGPPGQGVNYQRCHIPPSCWLHKKNLIDDVGLWSNPHQIYFNIDIEYIGRVFKASKKISFKNNHIVLKFPAEHWALYSKKDRFPQVDYLLAIQNNPAKVTTEILYELALAYSQHYWPVYPIRRSLRMLFKNVFFRVMDFYSMDRWPVKQLLILRQRKIRKGQRRKKGLPVT